MPRAIFLFDGGNYKRGIDSGRVREPLNHNEAELIFTDFALASKAHTSIGSELNMMKWKSELCNLEVGDELFIGLAPDAAFYRGLWMLSHDAVPGFTGELDLVSVKDVYDAHVAGDALGVAPFNAAPLAYDFANGLGNATIDAANLAQLYGGVEADYRNNDALAAGPFATPLVATLGQSLYFRFTITAVADSMTETGCCSTCENDNLPTFQVGAVYDVLCADKQRVRKFCNCNESLHGDECPEPTAPVTPGEPDPDPTPPGVVLSFVSRPVGDVERTVRFTFDQGVLGFDASDVTVTLTGGVTAAPSAVTTIDASTYEITYTYANVVDGEEVDFNVPAAAVTGVTGGLDNTLSNTINQVFGGGPR